MTAPVLIRRVFDWKIRGIRWIEIIGVACVAALILSVYIAKAAAARESGRIGQLEREIAEARQDVRLLRAEATRLEQPARLEALSRAAGLAPMDVARLTTAEALDTLEPMDGQATIAPAAPLVPVDAPVMGEDAVLTPATPEAGR